MKKMKGSDEMKQIKVNNKKTENIRKKSSTNGNSNLKTVSTIKPTSSF